MLLPSQQKSSILASSLKTCNTCRFNTEGICTWLQNKLGNVPRPIWLVDYKWVENLQICGYENCSAWVTGTSGTGLPE